MIEIVQTDAFSEWLDDLRDSKARTKIIARIKRLEFGDPGDVAPVG
jgi:putative addiction module killer protein